jgi:hypothetical protein
MQYLQHYRPGDFVGMVPQVNWHAFIVIAIILAVVVWYMSLVLYVILRSRETRRHERYLVHVATTIAYKAATRDGA